MIMHLKCIKKDIVEMIVTVSMFSFLLYILSLFIPTIYATATAIFVAGHFGDDVTNIIFNKIKK